MTNSTSNNWNVIIVIFLVAVAGYFYKQNMIVWDGFYYPEGNTLADPIIVRGFKDGVSCAAWANSTHNSRPQDSEADPQNLWECGKNCKPDGYGLNICKVTFGAGDSIPN